MIDSGRAMEVAMCKHDCHSCRVHAPPTHFGIALCFTVLHGIARSSNPACVASTTDMQKLRQAHVLLLVDPIHLFCWLTIFISQHGSRTILRKPYWSVKCQMGEIFIVNDWCSIWSIQPQKHCVSFWNQGEMTSLELIRFDYFG